MKDTQNEIKQNIQVTNSDRKETRTKATIWDQSNNSEPKEKINIHPEQKEEKEFKKVKRVLQTSGTIWNIAISEL